MGQGKDDTLFALADGIVRYTKFLGNKTKVSVVEQSK
ncbi:50S ribosomal protein L27 [Mycoplasmoides gallisepticum]|uniref:50S ribosomal protein L27 n=1 Tax=Mycoplasmoides gallisepticum TaxID=2096 RepID=A0A3B0PZ80_MYCGL|nr:50S ribosomal protein L27 [Mycoplasmoides gallisepticum]